jgi:hypothetical protein
MSMATASMAPFDTSAVGGVVEAEAVSALADLWLRGVWDRRSRRLEEAEGLDLLRKGDDPASKGWVVSVGVFRGGHLNRGIPVLISTSSLIWSSETVTRSPSRSRSAIGTLWTMYWDHGWRGPKLISFRDWVAFCLTPSERSSSEAFAEAARAAKPERVRVTALNKLS